MVRVAVVIRGLVGAALAALLLGAPAHAAQRDCRAMAGLRLPQMEIASAEPAPAGAFRAPDGRAYDLPAFCRVRIVSRPSEDSRIGIEVWLPAHGWTGRFHQFANGGYSGAIPFAVLAGALNEGAAAAATDDGHTGDGSDASWALGHPEKIVDFAYRAQRETTRAAKALIAAFYGVGPRYSYFAGCSGGGRQALLQAQRYPNEWDGILVGAPGSSATRLVAAFTANARALRELGPDKIPAWKLPFIQRASRQACRPRAHAVDGVAADPRLCRFDARRLICADGRDGPCLSRAEASVLQQIYTGARDPRNGAQVLPGVEPTFEARDEFRAWILGVDGKPSIQEDSARAFYADMVFDDPALDMSRLDLAKLMSAADAKEVLGRRLKDLLNAEDPDLSAFKRRGGKLIVYHGWADPAVPPQLSLDYRDQVARALARHGGVDGFYRLFMAPGMGHCSGGAGADAFGQNPASPPLRDDPDHSIVRALEAWVETGRAPSRIVAAKYENGRRTDGVAFTRLLCPFPTLPVYRGAGSRTLAASFRCAWP